MSEFFFFPFFLLSPWSVKNVSHPQGPSQRRFGPPPKVPRKARSESIVSEFEVEGSETTKPVASLLPSTPTPGHVPTSTLTTCGELPVETNWVQVKEEDDEKKIETVGSGAPTAPPVQDCDLETVMSDFSLVQGIPEANLQGLVESMIKLRTQTVRHTFLFKFLVFGFGIFYAKPYRLEKNFSFVTVSVFSSILYN